MFVMNFEMEILNTDKTGKVGSPSHAKEIHALKVQGGEYLAMCQRKCLNLGTCIGIQFDKKSFDCKIIDVTKFDSLNTHELPANYTQMQLIHPLRNSSIYGYQTQLITK